MEKKHENPPGNFCSMLLIMHVYILIQQDPNIIHPSKTLYAPPDFWSLASRPNVQRAVEAVKFTGMIVCFILFSKRNSSLGDFARF